MSQGRLQQVGPPLEIYNRPQNVFVAGFVGNPSMNLIAATADPGRVVHAAFSLGVDRAAPGKVTLGQRPEDMRITGPEKGDFRGEVFSAELLGDAALVTVRLGGDLIRSRPGRIARHGWATSLASPSTPRACTSSMARPASAFPTQ
jgi:multiple sugar transport system ATP-binding protein